MAKIIYLMNTTVLIPFKRLESFLMRTEVIFLVKKQRELEKNSLKKKLSIIF